MTERKFHTVKVSNLPESRVLCSISNKHMALIILVWALFLLVIFSFENKFLAIPLGIYGLIMTFKEERMIFSGHKDYFVIYHEINRDECDIYYLSEIKRWHFQQRLYNPEVLFFLQDGETFFFCKCVGSEIYSYLRRVMPNKEVQLKRR